MKRYLCYGVILALIIYVAFTWENDFWAGRDHYGTLLISCEVAGLPIYIDEQQVGVTSIQEQVFELPVSGVYGRADHELIVWQEIDAEHEYYARVEFSFRLYVDVEENPTRRIALFLDPPENRKFPAENITLQRRLKPEVLARNSGLIQAVKLKHNSTWRMAEDDSYYYLLTRADNDLSRPSDNESVVGEFIEVYDKKTLNFIGQRQLSYENDTFSTYSGIAAYGKRLVIGTSDARLLHVDKESLKTLEQSAPLNGFTGSIFGLETVGDYLIVYGEGDCIAVYRAGNFLYQINEKANYPENITEIHDYFDMNRVNSVLVHQNALYAANWRGFINVYNLSDGRFLRQINTIAYEQEWEYVVGTSLNASAENRQGKLYFSRDMSGLLIFDPKSGETRMVETLFPARTEYSDLLQDTIDMTKQTDIYQMIFYGHYLLFSEVNALQNDVYAFDLERHQIVHRFSGHRGNITKLSRDGKKLTGVSSEGWLYRWDLGKVDVR